LAGVSFVAEGRLFCADDLGGQTVNIPKAASKTENCIAAGFHVKEARRKERQPIDCFSGKAVRGFMGLFLFVPFLMTI
jgi:hypothetical protein